MENVEIRGKITSDASQAVKSTNDYIDALKAAKKAVNEAKIGSIEHKKAQEQLAVATKDLDQAVSKSGGSFGKLKETLGATVPGFKSAQAGAEGLNGKLMALVTNPIGLILAGIVLTLTFLFKAFTSTAEGGKKLEQVIEGLKAALQVVTDRVFALGNSVIKFFSGDFTGAMNDAKKAVSGIGDEIARVYKQTASITKRLQELKREQFADDIDKAQREKRLAFLREQLNDETVSVHAKIAIAKELRDDQKKNAADDLKRATEVATLKIKLLEQEKDGAIKNEEEITALKISISKTETENALEGVRTNKVIRNLERQANAEKKAAQKVSSDAQKIEDQKNADWEIAQTKWKNDQINISEADSVAFVKEEIKKDLDTKDEAGKKEVEMASWKTQLLDFNNKKEVQDAKDASDEKKRIAKAELDYKIELLSREVEAVAELGNFLQQIAGKNKALAISGIVLEKAAAIGKILISGFQANAKSMAASPLTLGQPWVGIQNVMTGLQIGGTIAAGAKAISAMGGGSSGGGGGSISMPSTSAPVLPQRATATSTSLDANSIQGIGNAAAGGVSRSFILESDITNNRERAERINRASRLG